MDSSRSRLQRSGQEGSVGCQDPDQFSAGLHEGKTAGRSGDYIHRRAQTGSRTQSAIYGCEITCAVISPFFYLLVLCLLLPFRFAASAAAAKLPSGPLAAESVNDLPAPYNFQAALYNKSVALT